MTPNPMITDVDTCLKDIADWYVRNKKDMPESELESILMKHCGSEAEVKKFIGFLETEPGQLRFKTLLWERKGQPTGFLKGQTIVIKSKAIYGWRTWVTVEKDDPEHNQVWVKEITPAVKYEDIEEEEEE